MAFRPLNIDCLTLNYRIVGQITIGSAGVVGTLIDTSKTFLEVRNARMARVTTADALGQQAHVIRVMKNQIVAVAIEKREDIGPSSIRFGKVACMPVRLTTSVYEIEGTLEWSGRFDFPMLLSDAMPDYIPLFDASLGAILFPSTFIQSPIMLFNRKHLASFVAMTETI